MNFEDFPDPVKKDIEDSSLSVLEHINDDIIVIGGWAVRALIGDKHGRYTLDIDGVAEINKINGASSSIINMTQESRFLKT